MEFPYIAVYTIGRCVVLTCSDYFKSTGVLVLQAAAAPKGAKNKRERKRKARLYHRQRDAWPPFKRKAKKKSLALKTVDIKDSFRHMFADMSLNDGRYDCAAAARRNVVRFVNRSKVVRADRPAADQDRHGGRRRGETGGGHGGGQAFSIINVNDIIRDSSALLKF